MTIGENIQTFRKKKKMTQADLASKVGLAEITIRQYELGKRNLKTSRIREIASVLGVHPFEIDESLKDLLYANLDKMNTLSRFSTKELLEEIERRCE